MLLSPPPSYIYPYSSLISFFVPFPPRLTVRSGLLSDVLSEGGLLEMVLLELKRRAKILRKAGASATGVHTHTHTFPFPQGAFILSTDL